MNWWRWVLVFAALVLTGMGVANPPPHTPFFAGATALVCILVIVGPAKERRR